MEKRVMALFLASLVMMLLVGSTFVIGQAALTDAASESADLNDDGSVDEMDRSVLEAFWNDSPDAALLANLNSPDVNGDGTVDAADNALVLGAYGDCDTVADCNSDLNGDQTVDGDDIKMIEGYWGMSSYVTRTPDLNDDKTVDAADLAILLGAYDDQDDDEPGVVEDLNGDGSVDVMDRKLLEAFWNDSPDADLLASLNTPDLNGDGTIGAADNALVLGAFGDCGDLVCLEDLNGDQTVDGDDIKVIEGFWGMSKGDYVIKTPDLNDDGTVDAADLALLLGAYDEDTEAEGPDDEDENGNVDDDTKRNAKAFATNHGSRMRLLQLLRGAWARMLWAEAVVSHLEEKGSVPDDVIGRAKGIVEEMRLTLDEIRDLIDNPTSKEDMAEKFFHLIREIRDLVREFRILVRPYLTEGDRGTLRSEFNDINRDQLQEIHREILDARRALNAERAEQMGVNDGNLVNKIRSGEIPEDEIAQKVREHVAGLSDEEKAAFKQRLREGTNDRSDSVANWVSRYQEGWLTKATDRLQSRADSLQESGSDAGAQLFSDRASTIIEKREALRNKFSTAISNG